MSVYLFFLCLSNWFNFSLGFSKIYLFIRMLFAIISRYTNVSLELRTWREPSGRSMNRNFTGAGLRGQPQGNHHCTHSFISIPLSEKLRFNTFSFWLYFLIQLWKNILPKNPWKLFNWFIFYSILWIMVFIMYMFIIKYYYCFPSKLVYTTYHNSERKTNIINTIFVIVFRIWKSLFSTYLYICSSLGFYKGGYFLQWLKGEILII